MRHRQHAVHPLPFTQMTHAAGNRGDIQNTAMGQHDAFRRTGGA